MEKHELSAAEKCQLVRLHDELKAEKAQGLSLHNGTLRERLHLATGYAESTISSVIAHWNKNHDPKFAGSAKPRSGRPRSSAEKYAANIRQMVLERNHRGEPTTTAHIVDGLQDLTGQRYSDRTIRRLLKRLGFSFLRGQKRHILAESDANVAFRERYVSTKVRNRDHHGYPKRPEVFLDESYVNEHHVGSRTWLLEDRARYTKSGNGIRFCIIGADIVHVENGGLHAEWVEGALHYWQADLAPRADQDYHGNFDSPKFEKWFGELCQTLQHKYGPCNIIMDGASYHKRIVLPTPKTSTSRKSIIAWPLKKGIPWESSMKKKGLLRLVKAQSSAIFAVQVRPVSWQST